MGRLIHCAKCGNLHPSDWDCTKAEAADKVLHDRAASRDRLGTFLKKAELAQELKSIWQMTPGWGVMHDGADDMREALDLIATKLSRILCGEPLYADHWRDIAGYAMLVCNRLEGVEKYGERPPTP